MAGNADAVCDVGSAMFAREYLSVVTRWAREQLRTEVQTPANRRQLRQLIEAAEALRGQINQEPVAAANVVRLADHRRGADSERTKRSARVLGFLDN